MTIAVAYLRTSKLLHDYLFIHDHTCDLILFLCTEKFCTPSLKDGVQIVRLIRQKESDVLVQVIFDNKIV